jgi:hypothetical protein
VVVKGKAVWWSKGEDTNADGWLEGATVDAYVGTEEGSAGGAEGVEAERCEGRGD